MIQKETDSKIKELHQELLHIKRDRKYQRMIDFLHSDSHYNIALENYEDKTGTPLTYNISPAKDQDNNPAFDDNGISKRYIVKINDIAFRSVLDEERLLDYLDSPISPGDNYFVAFIDGKWGFYDVDTRRDHIPFYWTGKNGGVRTVPTPIDILRSKDNFTELHNFVYDPNTGRKSRSGHGAYIYKDSLERIYVSPSLSSTPKRIFMTFPRNDFKREKPYLKIQNIFGCFQNIEQLNSFKELLQAELKRNDIELEVLDWWKGDKVSGL